MIDIDNYKRAIQWLERGLAQQELEPDNQIFRDSVTLSFEVTYNLSESILRQALSKVANSPDVVLLSSRELMRYATDEGLSLASGETWLRYGIVLEQANRPQGAVFSERIAPVIPQYLKQLQSFSQRLEQRLV